MLKKFEGVRNLGFWGSIQKMGFNEIEGLILLVVVLVNGCGITLGINKETMAAIPEIKGLINKETVDPSKKTGFKMVEFL